MPTLRELRIRRIMSQADLSRETGIAESTISHLELGKQRPTFQTIRKLAEALGVEPSEIASASGGR